MKNIVILAFKGAQALDITGPMEVFSMGNRLAREQPYRIECLGVPQSKIQMNNGLTLSTKPYTRWRGSIDTIVVPGGSEEALQALREDMKFTSWLSKRLGDARRIVSVCTGAFVLAELGFLNGRTASTHWDSCERLRAFSPTTYVDEDAIFSKDGNVYTSAGVTAGIDLALSLVEEDLNKEVSLAIARQLVLYLRRAGGQSQFSVPLELQAAQENRTEKILEYIKNRPDADLSVDAIAAKFSLTSRHLSRLITSGVGQSPAKYVLLTRLETAKSFLQSTQLPISKVATKSGFTSQSTMSKIFQKHMGISPSDYRARFG